MDQRFQVPLHASPLHSSSNAAAVRIASGDHGITTVRASATFRPNHGSASRRVSLNGAKNGFDAARRAVARNHRALLCGRVPIVVL